MSKLNELEATIIGELQNELRNGFKKSGHTTSM